jgi:hypothetical protein
MTRNVSGSVLLRIAGGIAVTIVADFSQAQWVSVGGGGVHVRAPFVRVDVGPYGVSVRAPFTAIDRPGRYYPYGPPPVIIERRTQEARIPTADELEAMDDEKLRQALASTADRLHARLRRFDTGATWQRYLLRFTDEALADFSTEAGATGLAVSESLGRFRSVASEPNYHMIAELPAFVAMQSILGEMETRLNRPARANDSSDGSAEELPLPPPEQPRRGRPFFDPDGR